MSDIESPKWTYTPTNPERVYLTEALGSFFEEELITDILYKVRLGKEATCYCCRAHPDTGFNLLAAKVYRPSAFRAMKNDSYYRLGRTMTTGGRGTSYRGRAQRALKKHTRFGKQIESISWLSNEYGQLSTLHKLGGDVPAPIASSNTAILMEYLGDEQRAAPTLHRVSLDAGEAQLVFERVLDNITLMLRERLVHADLSAHNILYWNDRPYVIDLPQAVTADHHPGAFELLTRDLQHVCKYFAKQGVLSDPVGMAIDLWMRLQEGRL